MPKYSHQLERGFTLLEVLTVVGIFAVIGLAVVAGFHAHSGFTSRDDEDLLIAALQKARSQSMNGICLGAGCAAALPHGVHLDAHQMVIFQGASYDPTNVTNEYIQAESGATTFVGSDILFAPFSADVSASSILILDSGTTTAEVAVGSEGQISWSR